MYLSKARTMNMSSLIMRGPTMIGHLKPNFPSPWTRVQPSEDSPPPPLSPLPSPATATTTAAAASSSLRNSLLYRDSSFTGDLLALSSKEAEEKM
ncbi:hypothetical protein MLD38_014257 [Melastoma candidum]|uniref:Uncharacterized protein n=1 Tax=Melastoma candidum TaxID=119954 RepID=A0ACB9RFX0_9MYRT|nr:hypothetical protein MLD38_014257 [Melastoma candidum]